MVNLSKYRNKILVFISRKKKVREKKKARKEKKHTKVRQKNTSKPNGRSNRP